MPDERAPAASGGFLTNVESVRGIAAFYVAVGHTMGILLLNDPLPLFDQQSVRNFALELIGALFSAQTAVIVFFVISGLVIGRSLDGKAASPSAYGIFLVRRVLRLYPANIVAIGGIIVLAELFLVGRPPVDFTAFPEFSTYPWEIPWYNGAVFNPLKWRSIIGNLALASWSLNPVAWSLYVEVCVAPLLPLFHALARRDRVAVDIGVIGALIAVAVFAWGRAWCQYWFVFYLGMIAQNRGRQWARFLARRLGVGPVAVLAYLVMMSPGGLMVGRPLPLVLIEAFCAFTLVSLIVWCDKSETFAVLDHPLLRWNGRLSYSFYLWHFFVLTLVVRTLYASLAPATMRQFELPLFLAAATVTIALALGIAQLSYSFVEQPFVRLSRRLARAWMPTLRAAPLEPETQPVAAASPAFVPYIIAVENAKPRR